MPTDLHLNHLDTFYINSKINSWITVATIIDCLIFAGCNEGSIYLFKLYQLVYLYKFNFNLVIIFCFDVFFSFYYS